MDNNNNDVGIKSDEYKIESPIKHRCGILHLLEFRFQQLLCNFGFETAFTKTISMSLVESVEVLKK